MFLVELFLEIFFHTCCGWVGSTVVKGLSFGRVELEYGEDSEAIYAEIAGLVFLVSMALLVVYFLS